MSTTNYVSRIIQPTFEQWLKYKVSAIRLSPPPVRECDCVLLIPTTVLKWLVSAAFSCAVVYDLGVACVLCLTLHVSRTGLRR